MALHSSEVVDFSKLHEPGRRRYFCNLCGARTVMLPFKGWTASKDIVGVGYRENGYCPVCGSRDRFRLLLLYLDSILFSECTVFHISPESKEVTDWIRKRCTTYVGNYYKVLPDRMTDKDVSYDITNLSDIKDKQFDFTIVGHVLEHVIDFDLALKELTRVTSNKVIISVPINYSLTHSIFDVSLSSEERVKIYGQADHVRIFGADFLNYFMPYGKVSVWEPTETEVDLYALIPRDKLVIIDTEMQV